ncbi:MAG: hypothetical protein GY841_16170 [FCB group bacterium]|nr:hypothetical protein [FCB group bacterium]
MDLILTGKGLPFKTRQVAEIRKKTLEKSGSIVKIVEFDGGFALEREESRVAEERRQRVPLSRRNRMLIREQDKDPAYHYHIVSDDPKAPGRVQDFLNAWWEKVPRSSIKGMADNRTDVGTDLGSDATFPAGGGVRGVVMRIKREIWEQDQAEKELRLQEKEHGMRRKPKKPGNYGKAEIASGLTREPEF